MTDKRNADKIADGIRVIAGLASVESSVMPVAMVIAGLFPGAASVLSVLSIVQPYINRVLAAAPDIEKAVTDGSDIIDAVKASGPTVLNDLKIAYATMVNAQNAHVAGRPEAPITAAQVSDAVAVHAVLPLALGRQWTKEEENRWFDIAAGGR